MGSEMMYENFLKIEKEKQNRILEAAMMVFSKHSYKDANTEEIARHAGISKGLLFYYFKNKKALYTYLYEMCYQVLQEYLANLKIEQYTDFFDIMNAGAKCKLKLMQEYPYMMEFIVRVFYESKDVEVMKKIKKDIDLVYPNYFKNLDTSKFREDIDIMYVFKMLSWTSEGFLYERQSLQLPLDIDDMMEHFYRWEALFKRIIYKEEFQ